MADVLFTQRFNFNRIAKALDARMGISPERATLIIEKLLIVAKIQPEPSIIIESLLNDGKFTDTEKAFGIFALGEVYGLTNLVKSLKIKGLKLQLPPSMAPLVKLILEHKKIAQGGLPILH